MTKRCQSKLFFEIAVSIVKIWLSPEIARATAVAIHGKLVELMPQSRAKLDANLKDFEAQLASTETQVGNELEER